MTKKTITSILLVILPLAIMTTACEREQEETESDNVDIYTILDESVSSYVFDDIFAQAGVALTLLEGVIDSDSKSATDYLGGTCPIITVDSFEPDEWPKTLTIDFGNEGCFDAESMRSGKIIMTVSDRFFVPGSTWDIEFEDYYLEQLRIQATHTVTFNGRNVDDLYNWDIKVSNATLTAPNNTVINWESDRNREWIEGETSPFNEGEDEYLIRGTSSGVNSAGWRYDITIMRPLNMHLDCPWVRSGSLLLESPHRPDVDIDFGDGDCNSTITMFIEGERREVNLY